MNKEKENNERAALHISQGQSSAVIDQQEKLLGAIALMELANGVGQLY